MNEIASAVRVVGTMLVSFGKLPKDSGKSVKLKMSFKLLPKQVSKLT